MEVVGPKRDRLWLEGRGDSWQEERERGALTGRALHGNGPAVFLNDPEDHCEAQAGPFPTFFGCDKGLKDFREDIGRNPVSSIPDGQLDVLLSFTDGSHTQGAALGHGLHGIENEIQLDLHHLIAIPVDVR